MDSLRKLSTAHMDITTIRCGLRLQMAPQLCGSLSGSAHKPLYVKLAFSGQMNVRFDCRAFVGLLPQRRSVIRPSC